MKICSQILFVMALIFASNSLFGQDSTNCFLNDFVPKQAVIPAYVDSTKPISSPTTTITINAADTIGRVSPYLLGNAVAVWVGQNVDNPTMVNWIKMLSPNLIRFPGGSWSDGYFFNALPADLPLTVPNGETYNTTTHTFTKVAFNAYLGPEQALTPAGYYDLRNKTGAQGLITINYAYARYGTSAHPVQQAAHLAAEWVRYDAGRTKFWEIGNENGGPWENGWLIDTTKNKDGQPAIISGTLYGQQFKVFRDSMLIAAAESGSKIFVGAIIDQFNDDDASNGNVNVGNKGWNRQLFSTVGDSVDFYVWHDYYGESTSILDQVFLGQIQVKADMTSIHSDIASKGGANRPIALGEWNTGGPSNAETSIANGMQAVTVFCEMAKHNVGMSARWLIANWDTDGMFYYISPSNPGIPLWNPRPEFYYLYYLRQFLGDHMVATSIQGNSIIAYASTFSSGHTALVVVNDGSSNQVINVQPTNIGVGSRFYTYTLTRGSNDILPQSVVVNSDTGTGTVWGPSKDLQNIAAIAYPVGNSITFNSPANSVEYVLIDSGNTVLTSVKGKKTQVPGNFELSQNYPNPFNPTTIISYSVPQNGFVTLKVYNILGQEVTTLVQGQQPAGNYIATFNASKFASGVYLYRLEIGGNSITKKLVLLK